VGGSETYNPNVAAHGTNLSNVPISASSITECGSPKNGCATVFVGTVWTKHACTIVGEHNSNWASEGGLSYTIGTTSNIGTHIGASGSDWTFQGYDTLSTNKLLSVGAKSGAYDGHQVVLSMNYKKDEMGER
jgi:hypothetical protein